MADKMATCDGPQPDSNPTVNVFIVVMGVSGTGKSTLGAALAKALDIPYVEGDDLHPQANVDKMASGHPLTDGDREPWLELIRTTAEHMTAEQQRGGMRPGSQHGASGVVISCSALKGCYRDVLRGRTRREGQGFAVGHVGPSHLPTYFVFIEGSRDILLERMEKRPGHFMKASMLDSQLDTLESPVGEDGVVVVSLEDRTEDQVRTAREGLSRLGVLTL